MTSLIKGKQISKASLDVNHINWNNYNLGVSLPLVNEVKKPINLEFLNSVLEQNISKQSVRLATTQAFQDIVYENNGGIASTITDNSGLNQPLIVNGIQPILNDNILVKNSNNLIENGVYFLSNLIPWTLTRREDFDNSTPGQVKRGNSVFVLDGLDNQNKGSTFTIISQGTQNLDGSISILVGQDPIEFTQSGASSLDFDAENGISKTGSIFKLGGNLTENTLISGDTNTYSLSFTGLLEFYLSTENIQIGITNASGIVISDSLGEGIKYFADYSATFTDRSLVDKGYVDGLFNGVVSAQTGNAIQVDPLTGQVDLGGNLTGNVEILGLFNNDFKIGTFTSPVRDFEVFIDNNLRLGNIDYFLEMNLVNGEFTISAINNTLSLIGDSVTVGSTSSVTKIDVFQWAGQSIVSGEFEVLINQGTGDPQLDSFINMQYGTIIMSALFGGIDFNGTNLINFGDLNTTTFNLLAGNNTGSFSISSNLNNYPIVSIQDVGPSNTESVFQVDLFSLISFTGRNGFIFEMDEINNQFNVGGPAQGVTYNQDYSLSYVDRSLVDKGYVDGLVSNIQINDASSTEKGIVQEATRQQIIDNSAIGSTGARLSINPSTLLLGDFSDLTKDLKLPQLTTLERDALISLEVGSTIFNTSLGKVQLWNGTAWINQLDNQLSEGNIIIGGTNGESEIIPTEESLVLTLQLINGEIEYLNPDITLDTYVLITPTIIGNLTGTLRTEITIGSLKIFSYNSFNQIVDTDNVEVKILIIF